MGSRRWRRANSCGTSLRASASTSTWERSILSWPMVRAMMSRMTASVTKPSRTSSRPIGMFWLFCSVSAIRSWSCVIRPCCTSNSPNRSFLRCSDIRASSLLYTGGELAHALDDEALVEVRVAFLERQIQRFAVVVQSQPVLTKMLEAYRQVERVVRIVRLHLESLVISLLRVGPLPLFGIEITQRKVQECGWIARDQSFQARLACRNVCRTDNRNQSRLRIRIARVQLQYRLIVPAGIFDASIIQGDRPQTKQRINIAWFGLKHLFIQFFCLGIVPSLQGFVGLH